MKKREMAKLLVYSVSPCFFVSRKTRVQEGAILKGPFSARLSCSCNSSRFAPPILLRPLCSSASPVFSKLGSRSALYGDCEDYVLIEPGQDEMFVDLEQLRARLRKWLENWPGSTLPADLARFDDLDDAVTYLVESACELDISDGSGAVQWFEVRL
eukprot:c22424_g1_i1 orf=64-531(+)